MTMQIGDRARFIEEVGTVTNFDQRGDPLIVFDSGRQSYCDKAYVEQMVAQASPLVAVVAPALRAVALAACTPDDFDGTYDKGTIKYGVVTLKNGHTTMLYSAGGNTAEIELQGIPYVGKLSSDGNIKWSNSHLWIKTAKKPESCFANICSSPYSRAKETLRKAQLKGTIPDLVLAIKSVKAGGLASSFRNNLVAAETMLAAAQNKVKLELSEAAATGTNNVLERAIMKAKAAGLPREVVLPAEDRLLTKAVAVEAVEVVAPVQAPIVVRDPTPSIMLAQANNVQTVYSPPRSPTAYRVKAPDMFASNLLAQTVYGRA